MSLTPLRRLLAAVTLLLLTSFGISLTAASAARASAGVDVTGASPSSTAALAYSDFNVSMTFSGTSTPKTLVLNTPKGQLGVLNNAAICPEATFQADACPQNTAIGSTSLRVDSGTLLGTITATGTVYRIPVQGTEVGRIGIVVRPPLGDKNFVEGTLRVRASDYGISTKVDGLPDQATGLPLYGTSNIKILSMDMTLWGRVGQNLAPGFYFNPAECIPATTNAAITAYDGSTASDSAAYTPTNCAGAPFAPTVKFTPNPSAASTPTAFTVDVGQTYDPTAAKIGGPIRKTVLVLPAGVQLSGATNSDGNLVGCTDGQFGYGSAAPDSCPAGAKVGTVVLDSPLVGAIPGNVYLAPPVAGSGDLIRLFIVAQGSAASDALRIKLLTTVSVDPATGLLTNTLDDLPAQPVTDLKLTFRAGTAPGTRQPRTCGTYPGSASLTPFSSTTPVLATANYVVGTNCPAPGSFRPTIGMAVSPQTAGATTTGTTTIDLPIGDEALTHLKVSLPPGLLANIAGITRCTVAQAGADACPAGSQVATVKSLAGQSSVPGRFTGSVFLTDAPTAGALVGLYVRVPVVVGPIAVETIKIQAAITLRPDYGIDVVSDIPDQVRGLQLDQQELQLVFDRPGFLVNPPICSGNTVSGDFTTKQGTTKTASGAIAVDGCAGMAFTPSVAFSASTPSATAASALTTTVTLPASAPGAVQSAAKRIAVTLPKGVSLSPSAGARGDLAGCTDAQFHQADFADPSCPAGSNVGTVSVDTPSVGTLSGSAYLASSVPGHTARLFVDAKSDTFGAGARIKLVGFVDVDPGTGATVASFDGLPPVPFTSFSLTMRGGTAPVLSMPRTCGTFPGSAAATPWAGSAANPTGSLAITQDCPAAPVAFAPTLALTRTSTAAGRSMAFGTTVDVPAGSQALTGLKLSLPAGLLGEISSIPACSLAQGRAGTCGDASKIGTVTAKVGVASAPFTETGKAYLVEGDDTHIARLSIVLPAVVGPIDLGTVVTLADLTLRGDYGLDIATSSIPTQVQGVRLELDQFSLLIDKPGFMVNPVSCGDAGATAALTADAGGSVRRDQTLTTTGCDALRLDAGLSYGAVPASPAVSSAVTTRITAAAPSGSPLDAMKDVHVALPDGMSLSPSAGATGDLAECTAGQFDAADITSGAACPAGSKVGTVAITSPMVGDLSGDVYLGAKSGGDFAGVFFEATAADYPSLRVKVAGSLQVDPTTGNLTAAFDDLPQVQVSAIALTLRGGDAPVLSLPRTCGTYASTVAIARHGGGTTSAGGSLALDQDCPDPDAFAPTLAVGTSTTQAGANTALTTQISVPARQGELRSLALAMPRGLLGRLTVVPQCPLAQAAAGTCDAASLVGSVTAKVGVASAPYTVTGQAYMTAGTDDAIAGLAFVLPAKVGPIDLGNVVTLAKLKIEGNDLQLKISSDTIPTRVQGIPLSIRDLAITIDKPGVVLNASNCAPGTVTAAFGSAQGGVASAGAPYAATGCGALAWQPKMDLQFTGAASDLVVKGHPTITTTISQTEGQGDLRTADVLLPTGVATDLANINGRVCESAAAASAGTCAPSAQVGSVDITTSTLPRPITAPIYIVRVPGQVLPGLAIRVRDQIAFDIVGTVKIVNARLEVVFDGLPDAPISKMSLVFAGGKTGVIQLGSAICGVPGVATDATLSAQHGAQVKRSIPLNCNGQISSPFGTTTTSLAGTAASLVVRPSGHRRGYSLVVRNKAGLRTLSFRMPAGFSYTKAAKKAIRLRTIGGGKTKVAVTLKGRTIGLAITSATPVTRLVLNVPPKAARFSASTVRKLKKRSAQNAFKAELSITDREGNHVTPKATTTFAKK